jgi:hypothetical protein
LEEDNGGLKNKDLVGVATRDRNHNKNLPQKALKFERRQLTIFTTNPQNSLHRNRGFTYHCEHQKKTAESEDETPKLGGSWMSKY